MSALRAVFVLFGLMVGGVAGDLLWQMAGKVRVVEAKPKDIEAQHVAAHAPHRIASAPTPADEYAATLSQRDREYRAMYMAMWNGCKGYCVAGTGGREPRSGQCPFCKAV